MIWNAFGRTSTETARKMGSISVRRGHLVRKAGSKKRVSAKEFSRFFAVVMGVCTRAGGNEPGGSSHKV